MVKHRILLNGPPVFAKPRRLAPDILTTAKKEFVFDYTIQMGISRPSCSSWVVPLHLAQKENGDRRPCGHFYRLNAIPIPDRFPIPKNPNFASTLSGCTTLPTRDLVRTYHEIPMCEKDIEKMAKIIPFGLFEFPKITIVMLHTRFSASCHIYIDNMLIACKNFDENLLRVPSAFRKIDQIGHYCKFREVCVCVWLS